MTTKERTAQEKGRPAICPIMQGYWTNFAKTGDPNGGKLVKWPKFDAKSLAYMDFVDAGPVVKEGLRREVCDLWMENQKR